MKAGFEVAQGKARAEGEDAPATSEEEIETLVSEAIRKSRRTARNPPV